MVRETRYLLVGNLPQEVTQEQVSEPFERYGKIISLSLLRKDGDDNDVLGAMVAFMDIKSASKANSETQKLGDCALRTAFTERNGRETSVLEQWAKEAAEKKAADLAAKTAAEAAAVLAKEKSQTNQGPRDKHTDRIESRRDSDHNERDRNYRGTNKLKGRSRSTSKHRVPDDHTEIDRHSRPRGTSPLSVGSHGEKKAKGHRPGPRGSRSSSSGSSSSNSSRSRSRSSSMASKTSNTRDTTRPAGASRAAERRNLGICVKRLPIRSSDTSLRDGLFHEYKKHGKVTSVMVEGAGDDRFAIVSFKKPEDAEKALEASRDKMFFGTKIQVSPHEGIESAESEIPGVVESDLDSYHPKATRTLFVGNLEKDVPVSHLHDIFSKYGEIVDIDVKKQGAISAYAFVQFADIESVVISMKKMDGSHIGANKIKLGFGKSMPTTCVWVSGIAESVSEKFLCRQFGRYGEVSHAVIDKIKGLALVFFENVENSKKAVDDMRGRALVGKKIQVDFASRDCQTAMFEKMENSGQLRMGERPYERTRAPALVGSRSFDQPPTFEERYRDEREPPRTAGFIEPGYFDSSRGSSRDFRPSRRSDQLVSRPAHVRGSRVPGYVDDVPTFPEAFPPRDRPRRFFDEFSQSSFPGDDFEAEFNRDIPYHGDRHDDTLIDNTRARRHRSASPSRSRDKVHASPSYERDRYPDRFDKHRDSDSRSITSDRESSRASDVRRDFKERSSHEDKNFRPKDKQSDDNRRRPKDVARTSDNSPMNDVSMTSPRSTRSTSPNLSRSRDKIKDRSLRLTNPPTPTQDEEPMDYKNTDSRSRKISGGKSEHSLDSNRNKATDIGSAKQSAQKLDSERSSRVKVDPTFNKKDRLKSEQRTKLNKELDRLKSKERNKMKHSVEHERKSEIRRSDKNPEKRNNEKSRKKEKLKNRESVKISNHKESGSSSSSSSSSSAASSSGESESESGKDSVASTDLNSLQEEQAKLLAKLMQLDEGASHSDTDSIEKESQSKKPKLQDVFDLHPVRKKRNDTDDIAVHGGKLDGDKKESKSRNSEKFRPIDSSQSFRKQMEAQRKQELLVPKKQHTNVIKKEAMEIPLKPMKVPSMDEDIFDSAIEDSSKEIPSEFLPRKRKFTEYKPEKPDNKQRSYRTKNFTKDEIVSSSDEIEGVGKKLHKLDNTLDSSKVSKTETDFPKPSSLETNIPLGPPRQRKSSDEQRDKHRTDASKPRKFVLETSHSGSNSKDSKPPTDRRTINRRSSPLELPLPRFALEIRSMRQAQQQAEKERELTLSSKAIMSPGIQSPQISPSVTKLTSPIFSAQIPTLSSSVISPHISPGTIKIDKSNVNKETLSDNINSPINKQDTLGIDLLSPTNKVNEVDASVSDLESPTSPTQKSLEERIRMLDEKLATAASAVSSTVNALGNRRTPEMGTPGTTPSPIVDYNKYKIRKRTDSTSNNSQSPSNSFSGMSGIGTSFSTPVNSGGTPPNSADIKTVPPSDIMKSVLSRTSIFDQDFKRLETVNEKYEPKSINLEPIKPRLPPTFRTKAAAKERPLSLTGSYPGASSMPYSKVPTGNVFSPWVSHYDLPIQSKFESMHQSVSASVGSATEIHGGKSNMQLLSRNVVGIEQSSTKDVDTVCKSEPLTPRSILKKESAFPVFTKSSGSVSSGSIKVEQHQDEEPIVNKVIDLHSNNEQTKEDLLIHKEPSIETHAITKDVHSKNDSSNPTSNKTNESISISKVDTSSKKKETTSTVKKSSSSLLGKRKASDDQEKPSSKVEREHKTQEQSIVSKKQEPKKLVLNEGKSTSEPDHKKMKMHKDKDKVLSDKPSSKSSVKPSSKEHKHTSSDISKKSPISKEKRDTSNKSHKKPNSSAMGSKEKDSKKHSRESSTSATTELKSTATSDLKNPVQLHDAPKSRSDTSNKGGEKSKSSSDKGHISKAKSNTNYDKKVKHDGLQKRSSIDSKVEKRDKDIQDMDKDSKPKEKDIKLIDKDRTGTKQIKHIVKDERPHSSVDTTKSKKEEKIAVKQKSVKPEKIQDRTSSSVKSERSSGSFERSGKDGNDSKQKKFDNRQSVSKREEKRKDATSKSSEKGLKTHEKEKVKPRGRSSSVSSSVSTKSKETKKDTKHSESKVNHTKDGLKEKNNESDKKRDSKPKGQRLDPVLLEMMKLGSNLTPYESMYDKVKRRSHTQIQEDKKKENEIKRKRQTKKKKRQIGSDDSDDDGSDTDTSSSSWGYEQKNKKDISKKKATLFDSSSDDLSKSSDDSDTATQAEADKVRQLKSAKTLRSPKAVLKPKPTKNSSLSTPKIKSAKGFPKRPISPLYTSDGSGSSDSELETFTLQKSKQRSKASTPKVYTSSDENSDYTSYSKPSMKATLLDERKAKQNKNVHLSTSDSESENVFTPKTKPSLKKQNAEESDEEKFVFKKPSSDSKNKGRIKNSKNDTEKSKKKSLSKGSSTDSYDSSVKVNKHDSKDKVKKDKELLNKVTKDRDKQVDKKEKPIKTEMGITHKIDTSSTSISTLKKDPLPVRTVISETVPSENKSGIIKGKSESVKVKKKKEKVIKTENNNPSNILISDSLESNVDGSVVLSHTEEIKTEIVHDIETPFEGHNIKIFDRVEDHSSADAKTEDANLFTSFEKYASETLTVPEQKIEMDNKIELDEVKAEVPSLSSGLCASSTFLQVAPSKLDKVRSTGKGYKPKEDTITPGEVLREKKNNVHLKSQLVKQEDTSKDTKKQSSANISETSSHTEIKGQKTKRRKSFVPPDSEIPIVNKVKSECDDTETHATTQANVSESKPLKEKNMISESPMARRTPRRSKPKRYSQDFITMSPAPKSIRTPSPKSSPRGLASSLSPKQNKTTTSPVIKLQKIEFSEKKDEDVGQHARDDKMAIFEFTGQDSPDPVSTLQEKPIRRNRKKTDDQEDGKVQSKLKDAKPSGIEATCLNPETGLLEGVAEEPKVVPVTKGPEEETKVLAERMAQSQAELDAAVAAITGLEDLSSVPTPEPPLQPQAIEMVPTIQPVLPEGGETTLSPEKSRTITMEAPVTKICSPTLTNVDKIIEEVIKGNFDGACVTSFELPHKTAELELMFSQGKADAGYSPFVASHLLMSPPVVPQRRNQDTSPTKGHPQMSPHGLTHPVHTDKKQFQYTFPTEAEYTEHLQTGEKLSHAMMSPGSKSTAMHQPLMVDTSGKAVAGPLVSPGLALRSPGHTLPPKKEIVQQQFQASQQQLQQLQVSQQNLQHQMQHHQLQHPGQKSVHVGVAESYSRPDAQIGQPIERITNPNVMTNDVKQANLHESLHSSTPSSVPYPMQSVQEHNTPVLTADMRTHLTPRQRARQEATLSFPGCESHLQARSAHAEVPLPATSKQAESRFPNNGQAGNQDIKLLEAVTSQQRQQQQHHHQSQQMIEASRNQDKQEVLRQRNWQNMNQAQKNVPPIQQQTNTQQQQQQHQHRDMIQWQQHMQQQQGQNKESRSRSGSSGNLNQESRPRSDSITGSVMQPNVQQPQQKPQPAYPPGMDPMGGYIRGPIPTTVHKHHTASGQGHHSMAGSHPSMSVTNNQPLGQQANLTSQHHDVKTNSMEHLANIARMPMPQDSRSLSQSHNTNVSRASPQYSRPPGVDMRGPHNVQSPKVTLGRQQEPMRQVSPQQGHYLTPVSHPQNIHPSATAHLSGTSGPMAQQQQQQQQQNLPKDKDKHDSEIRAVLSKPPLLPQSQASQQPNQPLYVHPASQIDSRPSPASIPNMSPGISPGFPPGHRMPFPFQEPRPVTPQRPEPRPAYESRMNMGISHGEAERGPARTDSRSEQHVIDPRISFFPGMQHPGMPGFAQLGMAPSQLGMSPMMFPGMAHHDLFAAQQNMAMAMHGMLVPQQQQFIQQQQEAVARQQKEAREQQQQQQMRAMADSRDNNSTPISRPSSRLAATPIGHPGAMMPVSAGPSHAERLIQHYPVYWQGILNLKNESATVQMHFITGNSSLVKLTMPTPGPDGGHAQLKIVQRMRLATEQLDAVAKRMERDEQYCMLLALPCGRDHVDILSQTSVLKTGFIEYLQDKQAAGIVHIPDPDSNQTAYVVHIFPPCDFSHGNLVRLAPNLPPNIIETNYSPYLLIIIATMF